MNNRIHDQTDPTLDTLNELVAVCRDPESGITPDRMRETLCRLAEPDDDATVFLMLEEQAAIVHALSLAADLVEKAEAASDAA